MSKRKNIDDVIRGDRASIRGRAVVHGNNEDDDWDAWERRQKTVPLLASEFGGKHANGNGKSYFGGERCYHGHPPLTLPGTELVIHGGSCSSPKVLDADVYIGLCSSMRFTERNWPWKKGTEVLFSVPDMGVPAKPDEFMKMVAWTKKQLEAGLKVHCGCVGGHGRTGTFLAALVSEFGEPDAIAYVRKHYCKKAVESSAQVKFLQEHFGVKPEKGYNTGSHYGSFDQPGKGSKGVRTGAETLHPMPDRGSIWGRGA